MDIGRLTPKVTDFWLAEFGCSQESLFSSPPHIKQHEGGLVGYNGVFGIFRGTSGIVSFPPNTPDSIRSALPSCPVTATQFAQIFQPTDYVVLGPAALYYTQRIDNPKYSSRAITRGDADAVEKLKKICSAEEWDAGGSDHGENPASGVFVAEDLVALAGYEIWAETIAHIYIITHPEFRGRGYAQSAVSHLAGDVLSKGLVPQYRTLESNISSIRVAESLGFRYFASSVAVRLN